MKTMEEDVETRRGTLIFLLPETTQLWRKNWDIKKILMPSGGYTISWRRDFTWLCFPVWQLNHCESYICIHYFIRFLFIPLIDTSKIQLIDYAVSWKWGFIFKQYFSYFVYINLLESYVRTYIMRFSFIYFFLQKVS